VFAIALGWVIFACHTGIGGPLNFALSLGPLLPLSNLSYTAYLFHMVPVVFTYVISPFPMHFISKWQILGHCLIQLAISYCYGLWLITNYFDLGINLLFPFLAILCTLLAELPALNIERIFLSRPTKSGAERRILNANGTTTATGQQQMNGMIMGMGGGAAEGKRGNGCLCAAEQQLTTTMPMDEEEEEEAGNVPMPAEAKAMEAAKEHSQKQQQQMMMANGQTATAADERQI
jgi:hypothetical protein